MFLVALVSLSVCLFVCRAANLKSQLGVFETTKKRIFSFFGVLPDLNVLTIL